MYRALTCPSSGGKILFTQHLVSSLSVNVCTVHWLRADSTILYSLTIRLLHYYPRHFRALTCPSSGGKILFTQHLVSSLSVNVCTVHWLRADSTILHSLTIRFLHYYPRLVTSINMLIFRRKNCIHTASGIVALCKRLHSTLVESGLAQYTG